MDLEPDNLDLKTALLFPSNYPIKKVFISTKTDGYSKILRFSEKPFAEVEHEERKESEAQALAEPT